MKENVIMRVFQTSFYPSVFQRVPSHLLSSEMNDHHISARKSFGKRPSTDEGVDVITRVKLQLPLDPPSISYCLCYSLY